MSPSPADTAQWYPGRLQEHFVDHRQEFGAITVVEYDESARWTIRMGTRFTYTDPDWWVPRVGYFALGAGRFTALNVYETRILTHFIPERGEAYVKGLPDSKYRR